MRKSTMFWLLLSVIAGALLFMTSESVTGGRQKLALINHDIRQEEESLRVLQAEWSYLNQPERLEKLSAEYLPVAPMQGRQFVRARDLQKEPAPDNPAPLEKTAAKKSDEKLLMAETAPAPVIVETQKKPAAKPQTATAVPVKKAPVKKPEEKTTAAAKSPPPKTGTWKDGNKNAAYVPPVKKTPAAATYSPPPKLGTAARAPATAQQQPVQIRREKNPPQTAGDSNFNNLLKNLGVQ
jgi:hypothetical protein